MKLGNKHIAKLQKGDTMLKLTEFTDGLIKDVYALREDYVPEQILFREKHIKKMLNTVWYPPLKNRPGSNLILQGTTGTGKTLCANYCTEITEEEKKNKFPEIVPYYKIININCRTHPSQHAVAKEIVKQVMSFAEIKQGYPAYHYLDMFLNYIDKNYKFLTIVLDEVDNLLPKKGESDALFYTLVRAREIKRLKNAFISLVCIANDTKVREKFSDGTRSSFGINVLHFPRYTYEQLLEILKDRSEKAFDKGTLEKGLLKEIARYGEESLSGDCRNAISLLKISAEIAEQESAKKITKKHFGKAKIINEKNILKTELNDLGLHEKSIFFSVAWFVLKEKKNPNFPEVYKTYKKMCRTLKKESLGQRMVRNHLKSFVKLNLIDEFMQTGRMIYTLLVGSKVVSEAFKEFIQIHGKEKKGLNL